MVTDLFKAAANLPPPPSVTDLETAEEPGPESDRPSDIASTSPSSLLCLESSVCTNSITSTLDVYSNNQLTIPNTCLNLMYDSHSNSVFDLKLKD